MKLSGFRANEWVLVGEDAGDSGDFGLCAVCWLVCRADVELLVCTEGEDFSAHLKTVVEVMGRENNSWSMLYFSFGTGFSGFLV